MHPLVHKLNLNRQSTDSGDTICEKVEKLGLQIKKLGNLAIVKYPKEHKFSKDNIIRCSRGLIFDLENKNIVNYSLDGALDKEEFFERVDIGDIAIEKIVDGTMCNLYYYNNKWRVSTKFSIDASISKFRNQRSFRELLDDVINLDKLPLDTKFCYSLLLQHRDNRIVTPISQNNVYFLESTNVITGEKLFSDIGISPVPLIYLFGQTMSNQLDLSSLEKIENYVNSLDWKEPGVMLFSKDRKYRCAIYNPNYLKVKELLDNQFNIKYLLTKLLVNSEYIKVGEILSYYPEYRPIFLEVQDAIGEYCNRAFEFYFKTKISRDKEFIEIPKEYKKIIVDCHNRYKESREKGEHEFRVNISVVREELQKYDIALAYSMIFPKKN